MKRTKSKRFSSVCSMFCQTWCREPHSSIKSKILRNRLCHLPRRKRTSASRAYLSCSLGPAGGGIHTVAEKVFIASAPFWHPNVAVNMMLSAPTLLGTGVNVRSVAVRYPMDQDRLGDVRSQCRQPTPPSTTKGPRRMS